MTAVRPAPAEHPGRSARAGRPDRTNSPDGPDRTARTGALAGAFTTVLVSALCQVRAVKSPSMIVLGLVQPAAFIVVAVVSGTGGTADVSGLVVSTGLLSLWGATIWQAGYVLRQERRQGTLSMIFTRPSSFTLVLLGKCLGATLRVALSITVTATAIALLFGHGIVVHDVPGFVLALLASFVSATALGMMLSALFVLTRAADRISEVLAYPIFIVGGFLIPVDLLPHWVRPLSDLVSLGRGCALVRDALAGAPQPARTWLLFLLTTAVYALLAVVALRYVLHRARKAGNLDLF